MSKPDALLILSNLGVPALPDCPLNTGFAVLDQMLAAMQREGDPEALDATLDFRLLLTTSRDTADVFREFFRLRSIVEPHHYLACYRLRRWLESQFVACVQLDRREPPCPVALNLAGTHSFDELCARCIHLAAPQRPAAPRWSRVAFIPVSTEAPALVA